jgi:hypothetical protein
MESSSVEPRRALGTRWRWAALCGGVALLVAAVALWVRQGELEQGAVSAVRRGDQPGAMNVPPMPGDREAPPQVNDPGGPTEVARTLFPERALVVGIVRSGGASASMLESANRRVLLEPGERIEVQLHPSTSKSAVTVRADDGGAINGLQRQTQVELPTNTTSFSFTAGGHRGLYTVTVTRGDDVQILETWVGSEAPTGRAGPPRHIELPRNIVAETSEHP